MKKFILPLALLVLCLIVAAPSPARADDDDGGDASGLYTGVYTVTCPSFKESYDINLYIDPDGYKVTATTIVGGTGLADSKAKIVIGLYDIVHSQSRGPLTLTFKGGTTNDNEIVLDAVNGNITGHIDVVHVADTLPTLALPKVNFDSASVAVGAASTGGPVTVTVVRDTILLELPLTVDYSIGGTAVNGADCTPLTGTVAFAAYQSAAQIVIQPLARQPSVGVVDLKLQLCYRTDSNYFIEQSDTADVLIGTVVSFVEERPAVTVSAASGKPGVLTLQRQGDLSAPLKVRCLVTGSALAGEDYQTLPRAVEFAKGSATAQIVVQPIRAAFTHGEKRTVKVTVLQNARYLTGAPTTAKVKIEP